MSTLFWECPRCHAGNAASICRACGSVRIVPPPPSADVETPALPVSKHVVLVLGGLALIVLALIILAVVFSMVAPR